ncbi:hypothetical protein, partial [Rothia mucilaginosa]
SSKPADSDPNYTPNYEEPHICILLWVSFNFFFNVMHSIPHNKVINRDIHIPCTPRAKVNFPWIILWMLLTMLIIDITTNYVKAPGRHL